MSQLTEISIVTKKVAFWFVIAIVIYVILKFSFDAFVIYWKNAHPIPLTAPDVRFGKIASPVFTQISTSSSGLKFKLENVEGLPIKDATPAGRVYSMPKKLPTLVDIQRTRDFAAKLGFTDPEIPLTSTYFSFVDPKDKFRTLEIDTTSGNFKLKYDYKSNPAVFTGDTVEDKDQAVKQVKDYISLNSLFDDSLLKGKITPNLLYYDTNTQTASSASSLSETNFMKINFFRNDLDNKKILPPSFSESHNFVLYTPSQMIDKRFLEINYTFWPIYFEDFGTYPLRSSEQAWQDLTEGYALIINLGNNNPSDLIVIRNIYFAYYDSEEPQNFLQPIYVFEGDNDFVAYLPAIGVDWLQ